MRIWPGLIGLLLVGCAPYLNKYITVGHVHLDDQYLPDLQEAATRWNTALAIKHFTVMSTTINVTSVGLPSGDTAGMTVGLWIPTACTIELQPGNPDDMSTRILMHELGHSMGLPHDYVFGAGVMYPTTDGIAATPSIEEVAAARKNLGLK